MNALLAAGWYLVTAYCCVGTGGGYCGQTASGVPVHAGSVAADWRQLPPGTHLSIPGYGIGTVEDTGGRIAGHTLDVWFFSCADAWRWGSRTVQVAVVAPVAPPVMEEQTVYLDGDQWIEVTRWRDSVGRVWDSFLPADPLPAAT